MKNGIINLYKPENMTSNDCIAIMRGILHTKRVGHTGTLDPMATGVLPICIGKATRIMDYLETDIKEYRCSLKLGLTTDTQDIWGKTLSEMDWSQVTEAELRQACGEFEGVIEQMPPMYSAVRVNGKRLYEYAREGQEVERKKRKIFIESVNIEELNMKEGTAVILIRCSKGTYIRTICHDLGEKLGCGAVLTSLERTASGMFKVEDSISLDEMRKMTAEEAASFIQDTDYPLVYFGRVFLDSEGVHKFVNGMKISPKRWEEETAPIFREREFPLEIREEYKRAYRVYGESDGKTCFLGIGTKDPESGSLKGHKIFFDRKGD